jgi:CHAT domain-containing protein/tetratricopeptide (TPR) repeat protein
LEPHLSNDQIEELLSLELSGDGDTNHDREVHGDIRDHLSVCESCQSRVDSLKAVAEQLALLKPASHGAPGPACPPDKVWTEIAAGVASQDSEAYLIHVAQCDRCAPLLREAAADFEEELTPAEDGMISDLRSSSPEWQAALAMRLNSKNSSDSKGAHQINKRPPWLQVLPSPSSLGLAATILVMISSGIWISFHLRRKPSSEELIANAYAEKRTIEVRIEGAPYVPMRQERGGSDAPMSRPALLKAEAEIAQHLRTDPENAHWLQASGQASLLEGGLAGTERAVASLSKAHELDQNNYSISVDLASGYLIRGEIADRPEDVGKAIDLLGRVLSSQPQNEIAQFNFAIALERLNLRTQAVDAWQKFLELHTGSQWTEEARRRQKLLQDEIHGRSQKSDQPLKSIEVVAASFEGPSVPNLLSIDERSEEYQDAAVQQWLPAYFDLRGQTLASRQSLEKALFGLAALLEHRHSDDWLKDVLSAGLASRSSEEAFRSLAESERLIASSDDERARAAAVRASSLFEGAENRAGLFRARLDLVLIYQLEHNGRKCEALGRTLEIELKATRYPWLQLQDRLEEAACASTSDIRAVRLSQSAMSIARQSSYPILQLRAANFLAGSFEAVGDRYRAWGTSVESLGEFWRGAYPQSRGYSLLTNFHDLAEEQQQWYLETAVLKEAVAMIVADPDNAMRAFEEDRLGEAELRSSDIKGAERSFHDAQQLIANIPVGARREALSVETEVGLSKAELDRGHPGVAVDRLNQIRSSIARIADDDLKLDFFQASGVANLRCGFDQQARADLNSAMRLAEKGLRLVDNESNRWEWRNRNESTYRALVQLELNSDPERALGYLEWFKGATLRIESRRPIPHEEARSSDLETSDARSLARYAPDTSYVTYSIFPDRTSIWVADQANTRQTWISIPESQLSLRIGRFVEHCSDPNSSPVQIRQEAVDLYRILLGKVEPWIEGHRMLVVEPDGILRSLPFEILIDSHGKYTGDRFALSISPGIAYLTRSRTWTGIRAASAALIIGNPAVPGWVPLPEAEQEARVVGALFSHAHLRIGQHENDRGIVQEIGQSHLFHFAGHASADVRSAGLIMSGLGPLNEAKVEDLKRGQTQLAVLSACNTSYGSTGFFDDEDSFVRRLIAAGVPSVVASRWMVDSTATGELMKRFYVTLLAGNSVSQSLAVARQDVRSQKKFAHPFYWAGFSVFGRT